MKLPVKKEYLFIMIPAFLVYFYSESVLRQGAIANIDPKKFNIETVIAELPGSVRDAISYKIHYGQLQDCIQRASTDKDKAFAISNMADFIKEPEKRVELYEEVLTRYPGVPESARAFAFFLCDPKTNTNVSIKQYHDYLSKFSLLDQYYIWTIGLAKLKTVVASEQEMLEFLLPLLSLPVEYRDYSGLYKQLSELAAKLNKKDIYLKAVKAEESCYELPMLESILMEQMKSRTNKAEAPAK